MNTFDISTVYMAILTTNLLLMIISVIICNKKILINAGYKLIAIFLVLTALRFMLPIEFPFATSIPLPKGISKLIIEIFAPRFTLGNLDISIYYLIIVIWIVGIAVQTYLFIRTDGMIKRFIFTFGRNVTKDSHYAAVLSNTYAGRAPIRIFEVSGISTPFLYGFSKPYILVPSAKNISEQTLTYILKHEITHYVHHDLWVKFGVQLLNIVYWWNPFTSLLKKQVSLVIEMRIDDNITDMIKKDAYTYLQCLSNMAEYQDTILNHKMANVISFTHDNETELTRRFHMLMERGRKKNYVINIVLAIFISLIYLLSYLYTLEADYFVSEAQESAFRLDETNTFIVDNGDGTYDLYLGGFKCETLTSLDYYEEDVPIYTRKEFDNVQQNTSKQD